MPGRRARQKVPDRPPPPHFRPDVEGLRAVAVVLVMLYHAGLPFLPGGFVGVDIFFVISGYLITGLLVREAEQTGTISLGRFYARRAKRLLPAATLVLVVTALLCWWLAPVTERRAFGGDIASAAFYVVNWRLADRSVDYLAEDIGASPVQHFWSLAVEEQFYIVWPLLFLLVAWWVRRAREPVRPWLAVALSAVVLPSFVWSVVASMDGGTAAFFTTTTRLWELGVGAALAIGAPLLRRMPQAAGASLAWLGLVAILLAALFVDSGASWPGYLAALPVLGAAAVIAGGLVASRGAASLLSARPMVWIGGLSYSLYLWHWPAVVFATMRWGELSPSSGLAAVALSIIPAWLSYRLVENPARHAKVFVRSSGFTLSIGANLSLAAVVAGGVLGLSAGAATVAAPTDRGPAGAAILGDDPRSDPDGVPVDEVEWIVPDPVAATEDVPPGYRNGCQLNAPTTEVKVCEYGAAESDVTIALVGDSKAMQWITALDAIADVHGWRVVTYTKSACAYADATQMYQDDVYEECDVWNRAVGDMLAEDPPDYVITSQSRSSALEDRDDPDSARTEEAFIEGLLRSWQRLSDAGTRIISLADNPHPGQEVYECVAANRDRLTACAFDREDGVRSSSADTMRVAVEEFGDADIIDLNDWICPADRCAPVIGNVLIFRQGSHLTVTYVDSLIPRLEAALVEIIG
ncbi:acyltransferase family protein [Jiangella sp. DSM 45060]|uniref:acyltransferase family protein n=1 Tax=Jiangella sp. DSM 45060 TaxID=1798224 RepID=UPI000B82FCD9|nr:acyltransferase family protein [Jiangella sp. DSM 45060]